MKGFFEKRKEKLFDLHALDFDRLAFYVLPRFILEIARKYFRLEVEGLENVPDKGRAIVLPNHSGWSAFDAVIIGNELHKVKNRIPRILAHHAFFGTDLKVGMSKMGLLEATSENGLRLLKKNNLIVLFPEGERGNFKPSCERYHLQEFRRGFVRMAMITGAPIIPTIVIGAEETHINLASLKFTKFLKGQLIPIPLNIIPLPAKWKIRFLKPIDLSKYCPEDAENSDLVHSIADEVRDKMQAEIDLELKKRKWIYFAPPESSQGPSP